MSNVVDLPSIAQVEEKVKPETPAPKLDGRSKEARALKAAAEGTTPAKKTTKGRRNKAAKKNRKATGKSKATATKTTRKPITVKPTKATTTPEPSILDSLRKKRDELSNVIVAMEQNPLAVSVIEDL